jgi:hypothetical protein
MKRTYLAILLTVLTLRLLAVPGCLGGNSSPAAFYDAGAQDFTASGSQFVQYWLFRFDTSAGARTLTTPSASDLAGAISSPAAGQIIVIAVTADGANPVNLTGGAGVTIRPSAATVAPNSTLNLYCVLSNVTSGSQAVTIY